ncbi:MAG TPA: hypothetical protein VEY30_05915 [Myxococcaceae bacterium]|nr:hypothetical protein [Myxococcaceae bacterium]
MKNASHLIAKFRELVLAKNPDGSRVHSLEGLRDAFAFLALEAKIPSADLSPEMTSLLADFAARIGFVGESAVAGNLKPLLTVYFQKRPLNPALLQELRALMAEQPDV